MARRGPASGARRPVDVQLAAALIAALYDHARREEPRECCGLLTLPAAAADLAAAGDHGPLPLRYQPVRNVATGLHRFEMDAAELLAGLTGLDDQGHVLWGIVHSHPTGAAVPSAADLAEAHYPEAAYLVVSLAPAAEPGEGVALAAGGALRAYRLVGQAWRELSLRAVEP